ncbi:hypothetical protein [Leucobacter sp. L43]|uniref:hypothetical protein n=1 Tax=Leucobacter sp. L43 TaxID=2798040 RepID=UPI001904DD00|nr:hypothetical protein [Leucobacter sp. L43]
MTAIIAAAVYWVPWLGCLLAVAIGATIGIRLLVKQNTELSNVVKSIAATNDQMLYRLEYVDARLAELEAGPPAEAK